MSFNAEEFLPSEMDAVIDFSTRYPPPEVGTHTLSALRDGYRGFVYCDFRVRLKENGEIIFDGRSCPSCAAEPNQICHPDCPERG